MVVEAVTTPGVARHLKMVGAALHHMHRGPRPNQSAAAARRLMEPLLATPGDREQT
jgi:hypothetical protein